MTPFARFIRHSATAWGVLGLSLVATALAWHFSEQFAPPLYPAHSLLFTLASLIAGLLLFFLLRLLAGQQERTLALARELTATLRDSEESFRSLVEFAPDAIVVINERGIIESCNPACERLFGYQSTELIGRSVSKLIAGPHREAHEDSLARYLAGGETNNSLGRGRDALALSKDGRVVAINLSVGEQRRPDGRRRFIGFIRDISDHKRHEAELEIHRHHLEDLVAARTIDLSVAEGRLRLILESTADGLYGLDSEGRFTFVNPAACRLLGYTQTELIGRSAHATIHHSYPDGRPYPEEECQQRSELFGGNLLKLDHDIYWRANGQPLHVAVAGQAMLREGEIVGAVVSFTDIQARLEAEATLRRQAEDLREQYESQERFNRILVGRELDMIRLKRQINDLAGQLGEAPPYDLSFADTLPVPGGEA